MVHGLTMVEMGDYDGWLIMVINLNIREKDSWLMILSAVNNG